MSTTPEPRFEVPPEYAEVYERAYRRAYEQGLGVEQTSGTTLAPESPRRGRRAAVPRQRESSEDVVARRGGARRADRPARVRAMPEPAPAAEPEPVAEAAPVAPAPRRSRRGHRGVPRTGSTWVPLLVLLALVLMLVAGAFVLGRATASGVGSLRSLGSTALGVEVQRN